MDRSTQLRRPALLALLALFLAATGVLSGCFGLQEVRDHCLEDNANCPPCQLDSECVIVSNPCHETAHCTHRDTNLSVDQIGCNYAYDVPSDDVCRCRSGICRSSE